MDAPTLSAGPSQLTWESIARHAPPARPFLMAHRGASDDAPENTLASFALALDQGAAILETDLRFSRDGEIVLIHDATVERTRAGSGRVCDLTLAELKKLPPRHAAPAPVAVLDQSIPTLADLLQVTAGRIPLALELKEARFAEPAACRQLLTLLERSGAVTSSAVLSFHLDLLRAIHALAPQLPTGFITLSNPLPLAPTRFLGPFWPLLYANPLYVLWARRLGRIVCPLDPAPEPRLSFYRRLGLPVLLTNHPAVTLRALA